MAGSPIFCVTKEYSVMDIFRYIEDISYKLGLKVANYFHEDKDGIEETQYGVFAILSFLFEFGTGLIISLIFGYVKYFLVFQITYCFLRSVCGGEHCKTFASCWVVTNIISFVGSMIAILLSVNSMFVMIGVIITSLASVDMFYIIPKPSENSPSRGSRDIEFKRRYIEGTCVLIFLACILAFFDIKFVSASICSAYIMCYIMLSKYGEKFMTLFKF